MRTEGRRRHTHNFKFQALDMAETYGKNMAQIWDGKAVVPRMMYRWTRQFLRQKMRHFK
jgi:transposase-like protein